MNVEILTPPVKSDNDKKEYRAIQLPNGLKVILIKRLEDDGSENEINAAAALVVGVGSFDDPSNIGGLAHFLEHMLFMGSQKYPQESGYNDFISANGGSNNAMTENENTVYFFDVAEKAFPESLDRFGQQFIAPLLSKNAIQRERESVDSEFHMAQKIDDIRLNALSKSLAVSSHPASFFDYGNSTTLKENISDDDLYEAVLNFFKKYIANNMFLSVQSNRDLDELQRIVVEIFSVVKSGEIPIRPQLSPSEIFNPEFHTKMFYVKPIAEKDQVVMTWAVDSVIPYYKSRPLSYIEVIFDNGGEGGLVNYLREKNFATSVAFENASDAISVHSMFTNVKLSVSLTKRGLENVEKVLEAIFSYLLMLKETSTEEHCRLYEVHKAKEETSFKFFKEQNQSDNVMMTVFGLKTYSPVDAIRGHRIYQGFDEEVISSYINALNQRNFNLVIMTKSHDKFDKTEKYFGVEYDEIDFPEKYQKLWDERKTNPEFLLEKSNPFTTTNFEIFVNDAESPKYPEKIIANEIFDVWHKLDDKFKQPRGYIKIDVLTPKHLKTAYNHSLLVCYKSIFNLTLAKKIFAAKSADLRFSLDFTPKGFKIMVDGYNDKIIRLLEVGLRHVQNACDEIDESIFEAQKAHMKNRLKNYIQNVRSVGKDIYAKITTNDSWMTTEIYEELDRVTFEDVQKFIPKILKQLKIRVLVQGNLTKAQTEEVVIKIEEHFSCQPIDYAYELKTRSYQLPLGVNIVRVKSLMQNDDNSRIMNLYEVGPASIRSKNLLEMIELILEPKGFDFLRNKNQLGYSVGVSFYKSYDIYRMTVMVSSQEEKHSAREVYDKMEIFWNEIAKKAIEELSDEEFENVKTSCIKLLSSDDLELHQEFYRNWNEIKNLDLAFNRNELSLNNIKTLTKTDLQEFFASFTNPDNLRKLCIQVIGNRENEGENEGSELKIKFLEEKWSEDEKIITSIEEFKKGLVLHQQVKNL